MRKLWNLICWAELESLHVKWLWLQSHSQRCESSFYVGSQWHTLGHTGREADISLTQATSVYYDALSPHALISHCMCFCVCFQVPRCRNMIWTHTLVLTWEIYQVSIMRVWMANAFIRWVGKPIKNLMKWPKAAWLWCHEQTLPSLNHFLQTLNRPC